MAMRVLYAKMDKLVDKKILERLLPRAARRRHADLISGARESLSFSEASFVIKTDEAHRGGKNQEESSCDL
jgi:hypothetical protein